jgi:methyl-accepting chemotaxis protein
MMNPEPRAHVAVAQQGKSPLNPAQSQQVSSNIADVQQGASATGSASSQVLAAAKSLFGESSRLKREVGQFLSSVRAA